VGLHVVKVSGSLYDLPDLGTRLRRFLASLNDPRADSLDCLIVPGGGATADAIRAFDRDQRLGPEASHWLALRACALNAHFLACLLPGARIVGGLEAFRGMAVLDPFAFALADEAEVGCLPHHWDATSDSVAARVAVVARAELVLLKSVPRPEGDWFAAAAEGYVDPVFPQIVRAARLRVRAVDLRAWAD
jgi:aspartokinase-like uncharacterized kinase